MIYVLPNPEDTDLAVLALIEAQHERLKTMITNEPRRWSGTLRRSSMARAIRGSNTIEGYHATIDQAIGAIANEPPAEYSETWLATKGYRDALTYILQAAKDPYFEFSKQFLKSLHFMMVGHEMHKSPGQWRSGTVYVVNQQTAETVYEAPDAEIVNDLIEELVSTLKNDSQKIWPSLMGAMAHLNLTMIHPFKDGNGRMARALQTLVIARAGMVDPVLCSIEEWLGDNTMEYYQVLTLVGQGKWSPENNCLPWIRFCLKAHYQQARRVIRRAEEYENIYSQINTLIKHNKVNIRSEMALFDACIGIRVTNSRYRLDADVTEYVASRDLKRLSGLELLVPIGDGRARAYEAGAVLKEIRQKTRTSRRVDDPYALVAARAAVKARSGAAGEVQMTLPGLPAAREVPSPGPSEKP
jgi:Fic family protein